MTRTGRFFATFGLAIGILTLACAAGVILQGCNTSGTVAGPTPVSEAPAPVAAAPAPAPTATPSVAEPPASGNGWEGSVGAFASWSVTNRTDISQGYTAYYTSFDNQSLALGSKYGVVRPNDTFSGTFNLTCVQVDVSQFGAGGLPLFAGFIAKDGSTFNPSSSPEKVAECRTVPCVEEWREQEERVVEYGEYGDCKRGETQEGCYRSRRITTIIYEINSCTSVKREKSRTITYGTTPCECPCVETQEPRETPGTFAWAPEILQGQCENEAFPIGIDTTPQLNCHQVGTQKIAVDWICKADTEKLRNLCRNVACPTPAPSCENTAASYKSGANGGLFNLGNSGDAAELGWVNTYVGLGPWEKFADEGEKDDDCTSADVSAKVVIVKAGSSSSIAYSYRTYLNVTAGQQLCSYDPPGSDKPKDISHVTYFRCD